MVSQDHWKRMPGYQMDNRPSRKKILVLDDEEQIVFLLRTILNVYGYDCIEMFSPKEILPTISREKPDLILLDIAMPEIDGYEVCRNLKNSPETKGIPVVMITALALQQDKKTALEAGADGFILKPFDPRLVISEIERLTRPVG